MNSTIKRMGVIALVAVCGSAYAFDFSGGLGGGAIADGTATNNAPGAPTVITLVVSGTGLTITSLVLSGALGLTHTYAGDLTLVLSHGGVDVDLMDRNYRTTLTAFGLSDNLGGDYMFTDPPVSGSMVGSGGIIAAGTYSRWDGSTGGGSTASAGTYASFNGMALDGVWTLTANDWASADTGAIQGMRIVGSAVPEPASMAVLSLGAAALLRRRRKA